MLQSDARPLSHESLPVSELFNIYCDESCHLEHDRQRFMVLGAVWCPAEKSREIADRIREIKRRHGVAPGFEAKWVKVSAGKEQLYLDLLDYFFDDDDLHFRALIAGKEKLRHADFGQNHDQWYYKMYFTMLKTILVPRMRYRIYLDVKDTQGAQKTRKLHEVLSNHVYDFNHNIVQRLQIARSHEIEQMQLADLLIGATSYAIRQLERNSAKVALVKRMRARSGYSLVRTTLPSERKVNILNWEPQAAL